MRHDSKGHVRRLTKDMFYRKHVSLKGNDLLRSWLAFSAKNGTVYCIPCFFFGKTASALASAEGFSDWKNAQLAFSAHEESSLHFKAVVDFNARAGITRRIDVDFIKSCQKEREYWRVVIRRPIPVIKYLAFRGQAFRGDNKDLGSHCNGNYLGALELIGQFY